MEKGDNIKMNDNSETNIININEDKELNDDNENEENIFREIEIQWNYINNYLKYVPDIKCNS